MCWATSYEGRARELVAALKFGGRVGLADLAGALVADELRGPVAPLVVPVPAAPLRRRRRGFDAAELIARSLARRLGLRVWTGLRRRAGRRQVGRPRSVRLADPPRVLVPASVPERALLVDDVLTTGATLAACAAALRRAGCSELGAAVFTRAV